MKSRIHTFRAATMDQALDLVRKQLGQNVVVLESKEVETRRLLPWPSTRQEVEVSAQRIRQHSKPSAATESEKKPPVPRMIRTLAQVRSAAVASPMLLAPVPELPPDMEDLAQAVAGATTQIKTNPLQDPSLARRANIAMAQAEIAQPAVMSSKSEADAIQTDVDSLQSIVSRLERQSRPRGMAEIPHGLFQHYQNLIEAEIDDEVARDLIAALRQQSSGATMNSPASLTSMLTALIEREMRCAPPIRAIPGRRQIVSLVGPTGVGKTTTLAKLAGHFHLREGLRVAMVTVDTYRVGAIQQLQSYAEILQIPFRTAGNANELRAAVDELDDVDLIFVDTAGRSPLDSTKLNELRELLHVIPSDHVLLVMSLAMGTRMLTKIADQFALASPTSLVLTKLDEAIGCGGLLSVAREVPYPVSYLTTGQEVPNQIEPAHPTRLARLILGREPVRREDVPSTLTT